MQDSSFIHANDDIIFHQTRREFRNIFDKTNNWAAKQLDQDNYDLTQDSQYNENDFSHNFLHDENMSYQPMQSENSQFQNFYPQQSNMTIACT
jgi:hypothetical protein